MSQTLLRNSLSKNGTSLRLQERSRRFCKNRWQGFFSLTDFTSIDFHWFCIFSFTFLASSIDIWKWWSTASTADSCFCLCSRCSRSLGSTSLSSRSLCSRSRSRRSFSAARSLSNRSRSLCSASLRSLQ